MKILLTTCLLFVFSFANANSQYNSSSLDVAQNAVYKSVYKLNQFSGGRYPSNIMRKFIVNDILPLFDFDYMSNKILENVPTQFKKPSITIRIKNDIADTIIGSLGKARGKVFLPQGIKRVGNNLILTLSVKNIKIDLAMHQTKNGWKIFDIAMKNQSLISYYQQLISRK
jgi:ABC-type transporter MlaC component